MGHVFFPPEWYPQSAIQLTWPHEDTDWRDTLNEITDCFTVLAQEILKRQKLIIICKNISVVKESIGADCVNDNLILVEIPTNDTWARDHSGISVFIEDRSCIYDFTFNGWGLKFRSDYDNQVNKTLFGKHIFNSFVKLINRKNFVLEGGAIESDGKGTLLTTSQCLLSPNRNSYFVRQEIEDYLKKIFGLERVLWLDYGYLAGDDTDSHIDTLARFCDERTIAYVQCNDERDEHFEELKKMEEQLKGFKDLNDNPYNLIALPMVPEIVCEGERLPATYANFLIMNNAVLLPIYGKETDDFAIEQVKKAFPEREVIPINCLPIIRQHGSLHCVTMQYPQGFV